MKRVKISPKANISRQKYHGRKPVDFYHAAIMIFGLITCISLWVGEGEARTQKGRTAYELENPDRWENATQAQSGKVPKRTPVLQVTVAPTPYQRTQTDDKHNEFYERYFRKGKQSGKGDIPVTEEEKKSLINQLIPHFTPTAERDSQKQKIKKLIRELAGEHHRRQAAIERLSMIGKPAVPALKKALRDPYKYKRIGALTALGYIRPEKIMPAIQKCLLDSDPGVRQEAVKVIGRMKHRPSAGLLKKQLKDKNQRVRREAVIALGRVKGSRAEAALILATQNHDSEIRRLACDELAFFDSKAVLDALIKATHDRDKDICITAIKALGDIGDVSVRFELQALSRSEDRMIRQEALLALSNLN
ncbi:HEAT repeat domain-containing protein [bacterium]|nr:HEAT repeat domain-containing protein [bacterium]